MIKNFTRDKVQYLLLAFFMGFLSFSAQAQCAGDDASLTVCDKPSNQFIDLYGLLGPNALPGGTWTDNDSSGGLDENTGQLNTFAINIGGTFSYTYTVTGNAGCTDNSSNVNITLASYAGTSNGDAVACSDDGNVNLFQFTGGNPSPTLDGTWTSSNAPAGSLDDFIFNAVMAGPGTYDFTYTVPAQGTCPASSSSVQVRVFRRPESGTAVQQVFCETDDLSSFTNLDLRNILMGEDGGGMWMDTSGTGEISSVNDSMINVENIRDTFGPGTYIFTYRVNPLNPACAPASTNVPIIIEDVLDFNAATLTITQPEDGICAGELPIVVYAQLLTNTPNIPDGDYELTYTVNPSPNVGTQTTTITLSGGEANFELDSSFFNGPGKVTVEITEIIDPNTTNTCPVEIPLLVDTFDIYNMPDPSDTQVVVNEPICLNEGANFVINDAGTTTTIELEDGDYDVAYTLDGPGGTATYIKTATVTGGMATIDIASSEIATDGDYTITITSFTSIYGCETATSLTDEFVVYPLPDAQNITVSIDDTCEDETITVTINDPDMGLGDGDFTIEYEIAGAINLAGGSETVAFTAGTGTFNLPEAILTNGASTFTITNISNSSTGCTAINQTAPQVSFTIYGNPDLTGSTLSVADTCQDQPTMVTLVDSIDNIPDGEYEITYTLGSGTQDVMAVTTATNGSLVFEISAEAASTPGSVTLTITGFVRTGPACAATAGLPLSTMYEIIPTPILDDASINVADVCSGGDATVQISGAGLMDGTYEITYGVSGANSITNATENVVFTGGTASFMLLSASIPNTGEMTIDVSGVVELNSANACTATVTGLTTTFTNNPEPDLSSTQVTAIETVCYGDNGTVFITDPDGNFVDGEYIINYALSGANVATALSETINVVDGSSSISIDAALLPNTGTTTVTLESVVDALSGCTSTTLPAAVDFTVASNPDMASAQVSVADFCFGENYMATLTAPSLVDGSYTITYTLSGANEGTFIEATLAVTSGEAIFQMPDENLANTGETSITITNITNELTSCFTDGLGITASFMINEVPQVASENLTAMDACLGDNTVVTFIGAGLVDGAYEITYTLNGANAQPETLTTITVTDGVAQTNVMASALSSTGTTTFTITSISSVATGCGNTSTAAVDFEVNPIPDASDLALESVDICFGEDGLGTLTSTTLMDGNYTVTFDLSGASTATGNTSTVAMNGGTGLFLIDAGILASAGMQTITITGMESEAGCSAATASASADFEILPLPDTTGLTLGIEDICYENDTMVLLTGASNLMDGDYLVTYFVEGANAQGEMTLSLNFVDGSSSIALPGTTLVNAGETTVTITAITNITTQCTSVVDISTTFTVLDPDPPSLTGTLTFCINDDPTLGDLLGQLSTIDGVNFYTTTSGGSPLTLDTLLDNGATYYASITGNQGCEGRERTAFTVDLTGCTGLFIPEGFSPNGDGINDTFAIENIGLIYPKYSIKIFNRTGQTVFKGNNGTGYWTGRSNNSSWGNEVLPNGVYFYILEFNDGTTKPVQGNVYLNR